MQWSQSIRRHWNVEDFLSWRSRDRQLSEAHCAEGHTCSMTSAAFSAYMASTCIRSVQPRCKKPLAKKALRQGMIPAAFISTNGVVRSMQDQGMNSASPADALPHWTGVIFRSDVAVDSRSVPRRLVQIFPRSSGFIVVPCLRLVIFFPGSFRLDCLCRCRFPVETGSGMCFDCVL